MSSFPFMSFTIFCFDFSFFSSLLTLFVGLLPEPVAAITLYSCFSAALSLCLAPPDCACSIKSFRGVQLTEIEALKIFVAETNISLPRFSAATRVSGGSKQGHFSKEILLNLPWASWKIWPSSLKVFSRMLHAFAY